MPYDVRFSKVIEGLDQDAYYNDVCVGGDAVSGRLLPAIRAGYTDVQAAQEDWGWFIWFRDGRVSLAIDIYCDDPAGGSYRLHLTSSVARWLFFERLRDTPELERVRELVERELAAWLGAPPRTERAD